MDGPRVCHVGACVWSPTFQDGWRCILQWLENPLGLLFPGMLWIFKVLTSRDQGWKGDAGARAESGIWTPLSLKRLPLLPLSPPNKPQLLSHLSSLTWLTATFWAPGTGFVEDNFSTDHSSREMVSGWFQCPTQTVQFTSIIIALAPPQITRHQIQRLGTLNLQDSLEHCHPTRNACSTAARGWPHSPWSSVHALTSASFPTELPAGMRSALCPPMRLGAKGLDQVSLNCALFSSSFQGQVLNQLLLFFNHYPDDTVKRALD